MASAHTNPPLSVSDDKCKESVARGRTMASAEADRQRRLRTGAAPVLLGPVMVSGL